MSVNKTSFFIFIIYKAYVYWGYFSLISFRIINMKSIIIYSSRTGNTKKLAHAIYDSIEGQREIFPITDVPELEKKYDLIAVGFSIMAGRIEPRAKKFLSKFNNKSPLFLFFTHGSLRESQLVADVKKQALDLVEKAQINGVFTCQGEVKQEVINKLKKGSKPLPWIVEAPKAKGHPDTNDIEELKEKIKRTFYTLNQP